MLIVLTDLFYGHFNLVHYSKRHEKQIILTVLRSYSDILNFSPSSTVKATELMPLFYYLS